MFEANRLVFLQSFTVGAGRSPPRCAVGAQAAHSMLLGREPINSKWSTDVRFGAHSGLKSDITALPKSAAINRHHAPVARAELYGYRSIAKG